MQIESFSRMPKYTLSYFNFRARAELPRLIFAQAGVEYDDERIQPSQWLSRKPDTPFGQLPVLTVECGCEEMQICQSHSIARYLAREFGLAGKTNLEQARADMIVECIGDMLEPIMPAYREKDENKKMEMQRKYNEELPTFMDKMEKLLVANCDGEGYLVGDDVTWADLALMNAWHWIPGFGVFPHMESNQKLKAHKERIEALPRISEWMERRPVTPV